MKTTPQYLIQNLEKYPDKPALSIKDKNGTGILILGKMCMGR